MSSDKLNSFIGGLYGGFIGTFLSHPVDTIKTNVQDKKVSILKCIEHIAKTDRFKGFYRGILSPLLGVPLEKSVVFGVQYFISNKNISNQWYINSCVSGACAGVAASIVVTPVEKIKILYQTKQMSRLRIINSFNFYYNGLSATLLREVPGYAIYFTTYEFCKRHTTTKVTPFHIALYGGLSGAMAWSTIYPSDTIKTAMQSRNYSFFEACRNIYRVEGIRGFYRGYSFGLLRAVPLHMGVFLGYEYYMKYTQNNFSPFEQMRNICSNGNGSKV